MITEEWCEACRAWHPRSVVRLYAFSGPLQPWELRRYIVACAGHRPMNLTDEEYRRQAYEAGRRLTCRRKQCQAKPGKRCVTKNGGNAARDHAERFYDGSSKAASRREKERRALT